MKQNGAVYYYITNLQGDVVRLVNAAGNTAAWYKYDPYGNATTASGSHATINPLRYRGYYYDTETGLYYCQSRYYDPAIGRWINADSFVSTGQGIIGHNMFAYCQNNVINMKDASGNKAVFYVSDDLAGDVGRKIGEWFAEKINDRLDEIEEEKEKDSTLRFDPRTNNGGKIVNSFTVTSIVDIWKYSYDLKQQYPDNFEGSYEGIAVEWVVHNIACYVPFLSLDRAKDADVGSTIFEDDHTGMNVAMWAVYAYMYPVQFVSDLLKVN